MSSSKNIKSGVDRMSRTRKRITANLKKSVRNLESYIKKTINARRARKKAARENANKLKRPYGIGSNTRRYRRKRRNSNRRTRGGSCGCRRKKNNEKIMKKQ